MDAAARLGTVQHLCKGSAAAERPIRRGTQKVSAFHGRQLAARARPGHNQLARLHIVARSSLCALASAHCRNYPGDLLRRPGVPVGNNCNIAIPWIAVAFHRRRWASVESLEFQGGSKLGPEDAKGARARRHQARSFGSGRRRAGPACASQAAWLWQCLRLMARGFVTRTRTLAVPGCMRGLTQYR